MNEIEKLFYSSLEKYLRNQIVIINNEQYKIVREDGDVYNFKNKNNKRSNFILDIQIQPKDDCFSGYIPDFAIYVNGASYGFVIEIDGYQWHEKSREQARIDKEKERTYLKKCFIPVRFAGYEVYHHSNNCIHDLFEIIEANIQFFNAIESEIFYERDIDDLQYELYGLAYGKLSRPAIYIKNGKISITPNITETA
jgi:very-short-patch-repair endonuclease